MKNVTGTVLQHLRLLKIGNLITAGPRYRLRGAMMKDTRGHVKYDSRHDKYHGHMINITAGSNIPGGRDKHHGGQ